MSADWMNVSELKMQVNCRLHSPALIAHRVTHLSVQTNVTSPLYVPLCIVVIASFVWLFCIYYDN